MALSDENGMVMPVAPTGGGFGGFGGGDSWAWIILLFLFAGGGFEYACALGNHKQSGLQSI